MAAKHLIIAKTEGLEAGFDAFMSAPSSKMHESYRTISRKRSEQTRFKAYCDIFGTKIENLTVPKPRDEDKIDSLREKLYQFIISQGLMAEEVEALLPSAVLENTKTEVPVVTLLVSDEFITTDMAWDILGRGTARPTDGSAPATNGQLWRMNTDPEIGRKLVAALA